MAPGRWQLGREFHCAAAETVSVFHLLPKETLLPQPRALQNWLGERDTPDPEGEADVGLLAGEYPAPGRQGGLSGDRRMAPPPSQEEFVSPGEGSHSILHPTVKGRSMLWARAVLAGRGSATHTPTVPPHKVGGRLTMRRCALRAPRTTAPSRLR